MKLGLIADIHEQVDKLQKALERFTQEEVDQVVFIGDLTHDGKKIEETCRLLHESNVIGVWGNHDFGLCVDPDDEMRAAYSPAAIGYMTSLKPRMNIAGCHFTHVEPWLNPEVLADLWYFEGPPDEHRKLDRIFNAVPNRVMFAGHYHKWLLATPNGITDWSGAEPIQLNDGRYFVVVGALCEGQYATFDCDTSMLVPFNEK